MKKTLIALALASGLLAATGASAGESKPTIVLVHGAFADASSWNRVVAILEKDGYTVVAAANPLRGVGGDARYVSDIVGGIPSPVVLVGHSYGGNVITGGYVYRGPGGGQGLYFFTDFGSENLWTVRVSDGKAVDFLNHNDQVQIDGGSLSSIASFALFSRSSTGSAACSAATVRRS